jgi:hypothetical protein
MEIINTFNTYYPNMESKRGISHLMQQEKLNKTAHTAHNEEY